VIWSKSILLWSSSIQDIKFACLWICDWSCQLMMKLAGVAVSVLVSVLSINWSTAVELEVLSHIILRRLYSIQLQTQPHLQLFQRRGDRYNLMQAGAVVATYHMMNCTRSACRSRHTAAVFEEISVSHLVMLHVDGPSEDIHTQKDNKSIGQVIGSLTNF